MNLVHFCSLPAFAFDEPLPRFDSNCKRAVTRIRVSRTALLDSAKQNSTPRR